MTQAGEMGILHELRGRTLSWSSEAPVADASGSKMASMIDSKL